MVLRMHVEITNIEDVAMNSSSQGRWTLDLGMMVLSAIDPIVTVPRDREGLNQQEPNCHFNIHVPQVNWHYHAAPQMTSMHDGKAHCAIGQLADEAFCFGRLSKTRQFIFAKVWHRLNMI